MTIETVSAKDLRRVMTERLVTNGALRSEPWKRAFASVPREDFVQGFAVRAKGTKHEYKPGDPAWLPAVYTDASLLTQTDAAGTTTSSSSQPTVMAHMLEALDAEDGDSVLEAGLGTGYNAALLSHRFGSDRVFSMDVDPVLVGTAAACLHSAGFTPTVTTRDGMTGWPEHAPYDRLIATFGVPRVPTAWIDQVRPGGVIVANLGCGIVRLKVDDKGRASGRFLPILATFMVARPAADTVSTRAKQHIEAIMSACGESRAIDLPSNLGSQEQQFLPALAQPGVTDITLINDAGEETLCLFHAETGSWARLSSLGVRRARLDHGGPRDLWAERYPLLTHWAINGRPGPQRYGLTIEADGAHTLWLDDRDGESFTLGA
ncbi:protein-L-isoaspartate(D-aspartate) O-methyltransferase [Streptomyces sp. NPDC037389]|uniref:protein-L-isoaspartate(D-aspartate) O-methyltransferase n=1 Tax=Streptomyces sp. NPDC037389 TaxID=3155369 RepID=UPI0033DCBC61